jgi:hypothetical protein
MCDPPTIFLFLHWNYFQTYPVPFSMGRPPWWEDGSVIYLYNGYLALSALSLFDPSATLPCLTVWYETGFPFCRLLRLTGLRWRYCKPPLHGAQIIIRLWKKNSVALSPRANYTDWRPPLVDEIECQLLRIEGCRVVSAADPPRSLISVF